MSGWKLRLAGGLEDPSAPRVLGAEDLRELARRYRGEVSDPTIWRLGAELEEAGALERVARGVWANLRALPPASAEEAAGRMRKGAVVSLHRVLGEAGFLNNPSATVTAVVPLGAGSPARSTGSRLTEAGKRFHFWSMPEELARRGEEWLDRERPHARALPERALGDWLAIAGRGRAGLPMPPADVDFEALEMGLCREICAAYGVERELDELLERARRLEEGEPEPAERSRGMRP